MTRNLWLWLFIGSSVGLLLIVVRQFAKRRGMFRRRSVAFRWLGAVALNVVIGGVLLYFLELAEPYTRFHMPVNGVTLATVGVLGVPGLAALIGLKLLVVG